MEKGLGKFILGNIFRFDDYLGKRGLNLRNLLHLDLPAPEPAGAQFVFVGVFGKGLSFQFVEPSPQGRKGLDLTFNGSVLQAKPSYSPLEDHALPEGFLDRRVVFIAKFVGDGVTCSIISLEDKNSHTHTFSAVKGFTPLFMEFKSPMQMELFGFTNVDDDSGLQRFLMEEKNRSSQAVQRDGSVPMTGDLNMNSKKITNLNTDDSDLDSAANVRHVSTSNAKLVLSLSQSFDKKIKESHITSSASKKDAFRYIMEEVDESTSENNIIVDGIKDFPESPHDVNKKAYLFRMGKGSQNRYYSRLGLNMYKLSDGEYTLAIEFFPPTMDHVSVSVVSTSLNIGQQSTKLFPKYSRSIVHMHKYETTPPVYIYIDMECQGTEKSPAQGVGHLIVYGIEGKQNDVDSDVFDSLYILERGDMMLQTNLNMNGHRIVNSTRLINGYLNTVNSTTFFLNGFDKIFLKPKTFIKYIDFYFPQFKGTIVLPFSISFSGRTANFTINSSRKITRAQINLQLLDPPIMSIALTPPFRGKIEIMILMTIVEQ